MCACAKMAAMSSADRLCFTKRQRLGKRADFDRVFAVRQRAFDGPLGIYVAENELGYTRLGISMSRKVGNAARRNRIKRLLREGFRQSQHELPSGYDLVVVPRAHDPWTMNEYRERLVQLVQRAVGRP